MANIGPNKHLRHRRRNIYISLENIKNVDFFWDEDDVLEFDRLWNMDVPILEICEDLDRSLDSVFLLAIDRIMRNEIRAREGWKIY